MPTPRPIFLDTPAAYILVPPIWALSIFFALQERHGLPHVIPLAFYVLGFLTLGLVTFRWGRARGYALRTLSAENIARCLVMSLLMSFPVGLATAGLTGIVLRLIA